MRWLFSFLFFLHGTSIGTRQQGISYNVFVGAIIDLVLWFVWILLITDAFNIKIDL